MHDDQVELGRDQVRGLFDTISAGYQPESDLVPGVLAAATRAKRRRGLAYGLGAGTLAVGGALALTVGLAGTAAPKPLGVASGGSAKGASSKIEQECTGVYLPWTSGSDASIYGKGTNVQRTTICEQDLVALRALLPNFTVTQDTQRYGAGVQIGEIMPDQVAEMGPGMKADTPVLNPWQYDVAAHGQSLIVNIEYSRDALSGLSHCGPCNADTPLAHGFKLIEVLPNSAGGSGVQLAAPNGQYLQIFLGATTPTAPPVDPVKLVKDPRFTTMLAADLAIIGNN